NWGIFDDQKLLKEILKYSQDAPVIFVLNKMDLLDVEAGEEIEKTYYNVKKYLKDNGVENLVIMPISARAAKIFKGVLSGRNLTAK
ncbi:GTPase, partial [Bacillus safensis]|nr:GTPase [Bacillus safensis]